MEEDTVQLLDIAKNNSNNVTKGSNYFSIEIDEGNWNNCTWTLLSDHSLTQVTYGSSWLNALTPDGKVYTTATLKKSFNGSPINFPPLITISQIACGDNHSVALCTLHHLHSWGSSEFGQLGHQNTRSNASPTEIRSSIPLSQSLRKSKTTILRCGPNTTAILTPETLWMWGRCFRVNCEAVITSPELCPQALLLSEQISDVRIGFSHVMLQTSTGNVWTFGNNDAGQLGISSTASFSYIPVQVPLESNVEQISCGNYHCCAITVENNVLWSWGNSIGATPKTLVQDPIKSVSTVGDWNVVLASSGDIYTWDSNKMTFNHLSEFKHLKNVAVSGGRDNQILVSLPIEHPVFMFEPFISVGSSLKARMLKRVEILPSPLQSFVVGQTIRFTIVPLVSLYSLDQLKITFSDKENGRHPKVISQTVFKTHEKHHGSIMLHLVDPGEWEMHLMLHNYLIQRPFKIKVCSVPKQLRSTSLELKIVALTNGKKWKAVEETSLHTARIVVGERLRLLIQATTTAENHQIDTKHIALTYSNEKESGTLSVSPVANASNLVCAKLCFSVPGTYRITSDSQQALLDNLHVVYPSHRTITFVNDHLEKFNAAFQRCKPDLLKRCLRTDFVIELQSDPEFKPFLQNSPFLDAISAGRDDKITFDSAKVVEDTKPLELRADWKSICSILNQYKKFHGIQTRVCIKPEVPRLVLKSPRAVSTPRRSDPLLLESEWDRDSTVLKYYPPSESTSRSEQEEVKPDVVPKTESFQATMKQLPSEILCGHTNAATSDDSFNDIYSEESFHSRQQSKSFIQQDRLRKMIIHRVESSHHHSLHQVFTHFIRGQDRKSFGINDLNAALRDLRIKMNQEELYNLFSEMDLDKSGRICFGEFKTFVHDAFHKEFWSTAADKILHCCLVTVKKIIQPDELLSLFNSKSKCTSDVFVNGINKLFHPGPFFTDSELKRLINRFDIRGNGVIDLRRFRHALILHANNNTKRTSSKSVLLRSDNAIKELEELGTHVPSLASYSSTSALKNFYESRESGLPAIKKDSSNSRQDYKAISKLLQQKSTRINRSSSNRIPKLQRSATELAATLIISEDDDDDNALPNLARTRKTKKHREARKKDVNCQPRRRPQTAAPRRHQNNTRRNVVPSNLVIF